MYELIVWKNIELPGKFYGSHRVQSMEYRLFGKEIALVINYSPLLPACVNETEICHLGRLSNNSTREIKQSDWLIPNPEDEKRFTIVPCRILNDRYTNKVVLLIDGKIYDTEFTISDTIYPGGYIRQNSKWTRITLKFVPEQEISKPEIPKLEIPEPVKPSKEEKSATCGICFATRPDRVLTICDNHVHSTTCRDCFIKTQTCAICGIVRESADGIIAKAGPESLIGLTAKGEPALTYLY